MNIVKFQDIKLTHRNALHSYTLTMWKQKNKLRKQFHSPLQWKESLGIYLPKETKDLYIENYKTLMKEIKDTQIEKYTMFMDQKNQYSENENTTQRKL